MSEYSYRGRTVSEAQYKKLVMRREHGVCPLCEREVTECYGNMGKHIKSCVKLMGWDKTEQEFPMWQIGLAEYPERFCGDALDSTGPKLLPSTWR